MYIRIGLVVLAAGVILLVALNMEQPEPLPSPDTMGAPPPRQAPLKDAEPNRFLHPDIGAISDDSGKPGVKSTDFEATISGIDTNRNGVRDDIERHIMSTYIEPGQQEAMMQFTATQQALILKGTTPELAARATDDLLRALACARGRLGAGYLDATRDILTMLLNTIDRIRAYQTAQQNQAGQVYYAYTGDRPCL